MLVTSNAYGDESKEVRNLLLSSLGSDEKLERMEARYCIACPAATTVEPVDRRTRMTYQCTSQAILS